MDRPGSDTRGASRSPLLAAGLVVLALMAVGTLAHRPTDPDLLFGLDRYRDLPLPVFLAASGLLLALLLGSRAAGALARVAAPLRVLPPLAAGALLVAGAGAAFLLLPNYHASGDSGQVIYFVAIGRIYPSNPLTDYLFVAAARLLDLDPVIAIRLVSVLSGAVYAAAAVAIGRECLPRGAGRVGLTAVLLTTGAAAIFFGTIEVYAPVVAAISVYLLLGIRWLHGKGRGIAPPVCLGVAFVLHGLAGLLLPSLLVLANRGRLFRLSIGRGALFGLLFLLPVLVVFCALWFGTWAGDPPEPGPDLTGTFFGVRDQGPLLPLVHSPDEPRRRYALLDVEHAVGVANLLLLLAMPGLALLAFARKKGPEARPAGDPVIRFVSVAALFLALFPLLWNISYDLRIDWDLFSAVGVPVALLGGLVFFSDRTSGADAVRATALSVFCLLPVVLSNHTAIRHRRCYTAEMCNALRLAYSYAIAQDAVSAAIDGAGPGGRRPAGRTARSWREDLEELTRGLLDRSGALRQVAVGEVVDGIRPALEAEAARAGRRPGLSASPARVADILAGELEREVRKLRAEGRPEPPAEVVAGRAARRALARSATRAAVPACPDEATLELFLLDVLDAAMARSRVWERAEPRIDAATLRTATRRGFEGAFGRSGAALDAEGWGDRLAASLIEVLGPGPAGRRWRTLLAAQRYWEMRRRALFPAGEPEAFDRAERLLVEGDLDRVERYTSHWLGAVPDDPRWLDLLGGALLASGRKGEGQAILRRAIEKDPRLLLARIRLANELVAAGKFDEAEEILSRGLHLSGLYPWAPSAMYQLAWLRLRKGQPADAVVTLRLTLLVLGRKHASPENEALRRRAEALLRRATAELDRERGARQDAR